MRRLLAGAVLAISVVSAQANDGRYEYLFDGARRLVVSSESSIDGIISLTFEEGRSGFLAITAFPLYSTGGDGLEAWSPLNSTRWLGSRDATAPQLVLQSSREEPLPQLLLSGDIKTLPGNLIDQFANFNIGSGASISLDGNRRPSSTPPSTLPPSGQLYLFNPGAIVTNASSTDGRLATPAGVLLQSGIISVVPEPTSMLMFSVGVLLLLIYRRRA